MGKKKKARSKREPPPRLTSEEVTAALAKDPGGGALARLLADRGLGVPRDLPDVDPEKEHVPVPDLFDSSSSRHREPLLVETPTLLIRLQDQLRPCPEHSDD